MKVVYLMSGAAHMPYLLCSLYSLQKHWKYKVEIHCYPESLAIGHQIHNHPFEFSEFELHAFDPIYKGKQNQFLNKIHLLKNIDEPTLYLDADTTIHGKIDTFFNLLKTTDFVCTQFNNWESSGGVIRKRIGRLREVHPTIGNLIDEFYDQAQSYPSVNGGVEACNPGSNAVKTWYNYSDATKKVFIYDECCLHLLQHIYRDKPTELVTLLGGKWNCSPKRKFVPNYLSDEDIVIRHYHGDSNVRPNKSTNGIRLWYPIFKECLDLNIANVNDWWHKVNNKYVNSFMKNAEIIYADIMKTSYEELT